MKLTAIRSLLAAAALLGCTTETITPLLQPDGTPLPAADQGPLPDEGPAPDAAIEADDSVPDTAMDAAPDADLDLGPADIGPRDATPPDPDAAIEPDAEPPLEDLRLNEIDCTGDGWVEVVNISDGAIDTADWAVRIGPGRIWAAPAGVLGAGGLVAWPDGPAFEISCDVDEIVLERPDGTVADRRVPPRPAGNRTHGRLPDGEAWTETASTRGEANTAPGPLWPTLFDPSEVIGIDILLGGEARSALDEAPRRPTLATLRFRLPDEQQHSAERRIQVALTGHPDAYRGLDGKASFEVRFDDGPLFDVRVIELHAMVLDPSMMRRWAMTEVAAALGLVVPRLGYARVSVDGQPYGLYLVADPTDIELFGAAGADALFAGLSGADLSPALSQAFDLISGVPDAADGLQALVAAIADAPRDGIEAATAGLIDWDVMRRQWVVEALFGLRDGALYDRQDYHLWRVEDGPWRLAPGRIARALEEAGAMHGGRGVLFEGCMRDLDCQAAYDEAIGLALAEPAIAGLADRHAARAARLAPFVEADPRHPADPAIRRAALAADPDWIRTRLADVADEVACRIGPDADPDGDGWRCDTDCAPDDPTTHAGADDLCGDGLDQDCSGVADDAIGCPDCVTVDRGPRSYALCTTPRTWDRADAQCRSLGMHLVEIDSDIEADWLDGQARAAGLADYWFGLNDLDTEGRFGWSFGLPPGIDRFGPGEPDGGTDENCGVVDPATGRWRDAACASPRAAACESICGTGTDADEDGVEGCSLDCDDGDPAVRPGADEICGDGVDQDCDGLIDEGPECDCRTVFRGGHGYTLCPRPRGLDAARALCAGRAQQIATFETAGEARWLTTEMPQPGDRWWLGLVERFGAFQWVNDFPVIWSAWLDGQPADLAACPTADPRLEGWRTDACDGLAGIICEAGCRPGQDTDGDGSPACGTDCDDGDPATFPGAVDRCDDGVDQDCDGLIDEGC